MPCDHRSAEGMFSRHRRSEESPVGAENKSCVVSVRRFSCERDQSPNLARRPGPVYDRINETIADVRLEITRLGSLTLPDDFLAGYTVMLAQ